MRKNFANKIIFNNKGITLVELLIVLVLLAVVMVPAYNAIGVTNRIWSHNEAINPGITQANVAMTYISREIREAAQPSKTVDSVIVEDSGQRLVIYRYNENNNEWEKIVYQTANNKLNRIILSKDNPADIISAAIPGSADAGWNNLVEGVSSNPVFTRPEKSRAVEVNLQVSDHANNNPRFSPYTVASTYMVRSREIGAITGEPVLDEIEMPEVAVERIALDSNEVTLIINDPDNRQKTLTVFYWKVNANTGKELTWTSSNTKWVTVTPIGNNQAKITMVKNTGDFWGLLGWNTDLEWLFRPTNVQVKATSKNGKTDTCYVNFDSK